MMQTEQDTEGWAGAEPERRKVRSPSRTPPRRARLLHAPQSDPETTGNLCLLPAAAPGPPPPWTGPRAFRAPISSRRERTPGVTLMPPWAQGDEAPAGVQSGRWAHVPAESGSGFPFTPRPVLLKLLTCLGVLANISSSFLCWVGNGGRLLRTS